MKMWLFIYQSKEQRVIATDMLDRANLKYQINEIDADKFELNISEEVGTIWFQANDNGAMLDHLNSIIGGQRLFKKNRPLDENLGVLFFRLKIY